MTIQDGLLNSIPLAEGVVHVCELTAARELIVRHERMKRSRRGRALLKRAGSCAKYVFSIVSLFDFATLSVVEVAEAARTNLATMNVVSLQRSGKEVRVLSGSR